VIPFRSLPSSAGWIAGIAASLLIVAGLVVWQRERKTPERELAKAYEEYRTLELRVPDAAFSAYTPGSHTRGAGDDREAPSLLEARAKLTRELERMCWKKSTTRQSTCWSG
jgi:hypothetical protein